MENLRKNSLVLWKFKKKTKRLGSNVWVFYQILQIVNQKKEILLLLLFGFSSVLIQLILLFFWENKIHQIFWYPWLGPIQDLSSSTKVMKRNMHALHLDINSMWRKLFPLDIYCGMLVMYYGTAQYGLFHQGMQQHQQGRCGWIKPSNRFYRHRAHIPEQNGLVFPTLHSHLKRILHHWFTLQTETHCKKDWNKLMTA